MNTAAVKWLKSRERFTQMYSIKTFQTEQAVCLNCVWKTYASDKFLASLLGSKSQLRKVAS